MSNSKLTALNPSSAPVPLQSNDLFFAGRQGLTQNIAPRAQDIADFVGSNITLNAIEGIAAGTTLQSSGTVSFGDSNGLAFGLSNGTLTGSYTVPTVPPETPFGISAGTQSISTGTPVFADSNGITFGMSGSSRITASYTVPTVPAQFSDGLSNIGNTSGNTGVVTGRMVLAGGNNVTLSGSTNAGSMTITVSAANQTAQTQNLHNVTLAGNTSGVLAQISSGTMTLAGGNNITLSQAGNAVTIVGPNPTGGSFSAGVSTDGNTAGATGVTGTQLVFVGSNNITLSQTTGANGGTISIFGGAGGAGFSAGVSTGGNTLGSTGVTGTRLVFVATDGVSLRQSTDANGGTISILPFYAEAGVSNIGNTSGGTNVLGLGQVVFAGGNNITLSVSSVGGAGPGGGANQTITISAASQVPETPFGVSAGTQSVSTGTLVFSNSNNVTFGMSGSSRVTASASFPAETPFGVSAGTQSVSTGTLVFSNSNGITFGMSGSSRVTASYTVPPSFSGGVSNLGNTAGSTGITGTRLVLAGTNGVTLSQSTDANGGTATIVGNAVTRQHYMAWEGNGPNFAAFQTVSQSALYLAPMSVRDYVTATLAELYLFISLSTSSNSSHAGAVSGRWGIYTRNASTLSLATSFSTQAVWTNTSDNSAGSIFGDRFFSATGNVFMTPGEYYIGVVLLSTTTNANWFTLSQQPGFFVASANGTGGVSGKAYIGQALNSTVQYPIGGGIFSAATTGLPSSIAISNIVNTGPTCRVPQVYFRNINI